MKTMYKGVPIEHTEEGYEVTERVEVVGNITTIFDTLEQAKYYIDKNIVD